MFYFLLQAHYGNNTIELGIDRQVRILTDHYRCDCKMLAGFAPWFEHEDGIVYKRYYANFSSEYFDCWQMLFASNTGEITLEQCNLLCIRHDKDWYPKIINPTEEMTTLHKLLWEV